MSYLFILPFSIFFLLPVLFKFRASIASIVALFSYIIIDALSKNLFYDHYRIALINTAQMMTEIGFIVFGAFLFIEVATKCGIIKSLASLISSIANDKIIQGILIVFPFEMMIEGSSGFGTPFIIIVPILVALGFPPLLCAVLPLINIPIAVPFGALGTPIRIGFLHLNILNPSFQISRLLIPFILICPFLTLLAMKLHMPEHFKKEKTFKYVIYALFLFFTYLMTNLFFSMFGPEFPALAGGFATLICGVLTYNRLFKDRKTHKIELTNGGLHIYGILFTGLILGKLFFKNNMLYSTNIHLFNPGLIFCTLGLFLLITNKGINTYETVRPAIEKSKHILAIFFCLTFISQLILIDNHIFHSMHELPEFFLTIGAIIIGVTGTIFLGSTTLTNSLFATIIDPQYISYLAVGGAIGTQFTIQGLTLLKILINEKSISEKKIFLSIFPISAFLILLCALEWVMKI